MQDGIGAIVEGKVTGITSFGAFVTLKDGRTGLVHISEVADVYVKDLSSHLQEGQDVKVKIIGFDKDGKIKLSIKKAVDKQPEQFDMSRKDSNENFEDRMAKFLKDSSERISDLKKNVENKRGGGYCRKSAQF